MNMYQLSYSTGTSIPLTDELTFLRQQTGQDESIILVQALQVGLRTLYQQSVEQLFIDGAFPREKAVNILGTERVSELEYAQHALEQDVIQGLSL